MGRPGERRPQAIPANNIEPIKSKGDGADPPFRKPGSKGPGRKRTKSGCLTCRKRRIKCGEERPTCQNCVKSKRHCEGYNQRVIFKDPLNAYRPPPSTTPQVSVSFTAPILGEPSIRKSKQDHQAVSNSQSIAPKSSSPRESSRARNNAPSGTSLPTSSPGSEGKTYTFYENNRDEPHTKRISLATPHTADVIGPDVIDQPRLPEPRQFRAPKEQVTHYDFNALMKTEHGEQPPYTQAQTSPLEWSAGPSPTYYQPYQTTPWMPPNPSYPTGDLYTPRHQSETGRVLGVVDSPEKSQQDQTRSQRGSQPQIVTYNPNESGSRTSLPSPYAGQHIPVEAEREYYFPGSDEDIAMEEYEGNDLWQEHIQDDHLRNNDLGVIVARQASQDNDGLGLRTFTSFLDRPNILATYMPSPQATPLQDRMTAMIFCHFVNVTGPSMSIFERHPANPSLMFQGSPVPRSEQHIWAYTFPTLALQNPALLHAMLALASLHIAKLQGGPITASLKHYAIGLRRVAKSVSLPTRRGHPATLAAAMLLAFYECWSADHQKWSNHLLGAKQLVREIDFIGMTKYIKRKRAQQRQQEQERQYRDHSIGSSRSSNSSNRPSPPIIDDADEIDENLIGILMGKRVKYDHYGRIVEDFIPEPNWNRNITEKDLEIYETQRDLFWWYCKQDVYQAILGGSKLFMDYSFWSHCPPRAPLGRRNAIYGSFDHLILLMGRLADFAARDLKRKRAAMKINGGWRPPTSTYPSSQTGAPASAPTSATSPQTPTQMPPFNGMVPGVQEAQLPMGFSPSRDTSPQSAQSKDYDQDQAYDLHSLTLDAEEEWQEIRAAFTVFEKHLGEEYQPLGPQFSAPIHSPFGTALQYRTYSIAGVWMNFYMGLIACYRSHPSMPPASMVAAGVMRRQTEYYANQLGCIAAGIAPNCEFSAQVNAGVGGVLIESSTCLFVSAIQYHDAVQRTWTVRRLRHIARLTGWQTALAIASGCEASWKKTHEAGKGPAYVRAPDEEGDYREGMRLRKEYSGERRIDKAFVGKSTEERRLELQKPERVHYALGVLGLEEDFLELDVSER